MGSKMGTGDGLYKRGGRWWLRTDPVTGRPVSTGCKDRTAAITFQKRREREAADPVHAAAAAATVESWGLRLITLKTATKAAGTAMMYRQKLGHVMRIGGRQMRMSDITPDWVDMYLAKRKGEGAADQTLLRELTAILQLCKLAKRSGEYARDTSTLKPPGFSPEYIPKTRWLLPEQLEALLRQLPPRKAAHVAYIVATGARRGEADRAQPEDVRMSDGIVRLRGTKTRMAEREIPILEPMRALLESALPWLPLYPWQNDRRDLIRACDRAGVPLVTWNDLRRTTGTWLVEAGVAYELVAKILGHASTQMVYKVYGKPRAKVIGALAQSQIDRATVSRQAAEATKKAAFGPVAQSAELRIFNPCAWAEAIAETAILEADLDDEGSPGVAKGRLAPHKIATERATLIDGLGALRAMATELECFDAFDALDRAVEALSLDETDASAEAS